METLFYRIASSPYNSQGSLNPMKNEFLLLLKENMFNLLYAPLNNILPLLTVLNPKVSKKTMRSGCACFKWRLFGLSQVPAAALGKNRVVAKLEGGALSTKHSNFHTSFPTTRSCTGSLLTTVAVLRQLLSMAVS